MSFIVKHRRLLLGLLILSLLAVMSLSVILASDAGTESRSLSGKLSIDKDRYILQSGREKLILCFLPPAALDSLGFRPEEGDELSVNGYISKYVLVVQDTVWKGRSYVFRDSLYQFTRPETGTWAVDPVACNGCGVCVNPCPGGAIMLEKTPKGTKAVIDQSLCMGCNICVTGNNFNYRGCPLKAISK